ncbi:MAG: phosphoribulokinase, partial [Rhodospirillales bacterium]|nr:phosphoribulokinase [Rhodospirillales bacterium]
MVEQVRCVAMAAKAVARRMRRDNPVIIGIVGDSGAGKSTMACGVAEVLGQERTLIISMDDYIRYGRKERAEVGLTAHDPAGNYIDILEQHLALLREGQPILKPVYNHRGGVLEPPEYVEPKDFIILEGLLGYATPTLLDAYDVKFFLEPQEQLRMRWKFQRDTTMGGYTVDQVMATLDRLNRDSAIHVRPQRDVADMVISFYPPEDRADEVGSRLNVRHLLRPTLPQVDLATMVELGAARPSVEMELARDIDGHRLGRQQLLRLDAAALRIDELRLADDHRRPVAADHDIGRRHLGALAVGDLEGPRRSPSGNEELAVVVGGLAVEGLQAAFAPALGAVVAEDEDDHAQHDAEQQRCEHEQRRDAQGDRLTPRGDRGDPPQAAVEPAL